MRRVEGQGSRIDGFPHPAPELTGTVQPFSTLDSRLSTQWGVAHPLPLQPNAKDGGRR